MTTFHKKNGFHISAESGLVLGWMIFVLFSCKKDNTVYSSSTTVNVVNAAVNVAAIKVNLNNTPIVYASASQVAYGAAALYFTTGPTSPVTIVVSADTTTFLVKNAISFQPGVYTMIIAGQSPAIDTLIRQEINYPYIHNDPTAIDSSINIRFVNLSPNSSPVNINIKNSASTEVSNLGYKDMTAFKKYAALSGNTKYIFEIRNATTNTLLTTYTLSITATNRFKNVAITLKGLVGTTSGTNAFGVFVVNYF